MNALDRIEAALAATSGTGLIPPLTRDTIASLVAVARAADEVRPGAGDEWHREWVGVFDLKDALTPFLEEENDE